MPEYKAPIRDVRFILYDVLQAEAAYKDIPRYAHLGRGDFDPIMEEQARFAENVVAPLSRSGDEEGVGFADGKVTLPKGWKEAYRMYVENGWPLLEAGEEFGGMGLPSTMGIALSEALAGASTCWGMLPGLTSAAVEVIEAVGSPELKAKYLQKMVSCEWYGTMCLTEAHCGTDLGLVRTKAVPRDDGSYTVSGSKIFITGGDHDAADNIVHLVLARLPGAPEGTKGISLIAVPKYKANPDGSIGDFNQVTVSSIEHKMGIKASPTCVLNFENSEGFIVGEPHKGLSYMFIMMNIARIGTGIQGLAVGEASFQGALAYAKDRLQMRALTGPANPEGPADPIIVHPDVRRMLLTQKALAEGGRALAYYATLIADQAHHGADEAGREESSAVLGVLTPIVKAFLTETGVESTNHGMQVLGGHGYICESGMEQLARDARITPIYEGTTGIQALDLLGRKVLMNEGRNLQKLTQMINRFCEENSGNEAMAACVAPLVESNKVWSDLTQEVSGRAMKNFNEVGAASVDYLMYSGYVLVGYFWAKMARVAQDKLAAEGVSARDRDFYTAKIKTARFYMDKILPRTATLAATIRTGSESLMDMDAELFGLQS